MQYTGMILDLDGFAGSVTVSNSQFTGLGPLYATCGVAGAMQSTPSYSASSDSYSSYGVKDTYQVKSLISIVNHKFTVDIWGNTFLRNAGTKGVIYLDLKHKTNVRRLLLMNNTFTQNSGYLESSVIFIRARGPYEGGSVYTRIPSSSTPSNPISPTPSSDSEPQTSYFCSGYHIENNKFMQNIGCTMYSGGVIKFQCVDYAEASTSSNDIIGNTALSSSTLQSYKTINFNGHIKRYESISN